MLTPEQTLHVQIGFAGVTPPPYRVFEDGRALWVYLMITGNGRLCLGSEGNRWGFDAAWCYPSPAAAFAAADAWDGTGEPGGWMKNLQTGEYRAPAEVAHA